MARGQRSPSQSWKTVLWNHAEGIASIDFFLVSSATFRLPFGHVVLRHDRRCLAHVAVTAHPTADWIARQISEAFPWDTAPTYLNRDRDSACGKMYRQRVSPGSPHCAPVTVTKRLRRAFDRIGTAGMPGPSDHLRRGVPAPRVACIHRLLQSYSDPFVVGQRYASCTADSAGRSDPVRTSSRWPPLLIRPNMIVGRHRARRRPSAGQVRHRSPLSAGPAR